MNSALDTGRENAAHLPDWRRIKGRILFKNGIHLFLGEIDISLFPSTRLIDRLEKSADARKIILRYLEHDLSFFRMSNAWGNISLLSSRMRQQAVISIEQCLIQLGVGQSICSKVFDIFLRFSTSYFSYSSNFLPSELPDEISFRSVENEALLELGPAKYSNRNNFSYSSRKDRRVGPIEFLVRNYEYQISKGLRLSDIKRQDKGLYNALIYWSRKNGKALDPYIRYGKPGAPLIDADIDQADLEPDKDVRDYELKRAIERRAKDRARKQNARAKPQP